MGALSLGSIHLALASDRRGPKWRIFLGALCQMLVLFLFGAFTLGVGFAAGLDARLGADPSVAVNYQPLHDCMWGDAWAIQFGETSVDCSIAHIWPTGVVRALTTDCRPNACAHTRWVRLSCWKLFEIVYQLEMASHGVGPIDGRRDR